MADIIEFKAKLSLDRFRRADAANNRWSVIVEPGIDPKSLSEPSYWSVVSAKLRPRDEVRAWADDGSWLAIGVVTEVGRNWAKIAVLDVHALTTPDVALSQVAKERGFKVLHRGIHKQWSVKRLSDDAILHEGEPSREKAEGWLKEHLKAVPAPA